MKNRESDPLFQDHSDTLDVDLIAAECSGEKAVSESSREVEPPIRPLVRVEEGRRPVAHDKEQKEERERVQCVKQDGGGLKGKRDQVVHRQSHGGMRRGEGNESASSTV